MADLFRCFICTRSEQARCQTRRLRRARRKKRQASEKFDGVVVFPQLPRTQPRRRRNLPTKQAAGDEKGGRFCSRVDKGRCKQDWSNETYEISRGHSGLMPANLITLAHFSVSSAMSLPKSAGEPASTMPPSSANFALIPASARAALISPLSF